MADIKKAGAALSRRNVLAGIGGSAAALALAACGSSSSGASSSTKPLSASTSLPKSKLSLTMFWWSGFDSVARQYIADYTERHPNVSVKLYLNSNALGYPKIVAQRQVDRSNPLVNFGLFNGTTRQEGVTDKMWSAMDFSSLSNAKDIIPSMVPADKFGIGLSTEQLGLIYNTKTAPAPLASWNDLLKPTYKGDMVIFTEPWWAVFMAAKLHGGGIDNMQPGWDLWQQAAKNGQIKLTVTDNSAYVNALSNGTASITSYFAGTAQLWINSGAPLKYVTPAEGAVPSPNYLCVVDDSTEDQKAVEFKYQWERELLSGPDAYEVVTSNTFGKIGRMIDMLIDADIAMEFECYDVGHLYILDYHLQ